MIDLIPRMFMHADWANRRLIEGLRSLSIPVEQRMLDTLAHLLSSERMWLARIRGEDTSGTQVRPRLSLDECELLANDVARDYAYYLRSLSDEDLERSITYKNAQGFEFQTAVKDMLVQALLHGSYHRGQIASAIRESGGEPVATDYIRFVREESAIRTVPGTV